MTIVIVTIPRGRAQINRTVCNYTVTQMSYTDRGGQVENSSPQVESFVVRFIHDAPEQRAWRCVIVHVQSRVEENFSDFADAIAFIARYVPVAQIQKIGDNTNGE